MIYGRIGRTADEILLCGLMTAEMRSVVIRPNANLFAIDVSVSDLGIDDSTEQNATANQKEWNRMTCKEPKPCSDDSS